MWSNKTLNLYFFYYHIWVTWSSQEQDKKVHGQKVEGLCPPSLKVKERLPPPRSYPSEIQHILGKQLCYICFDVGWLFWTSLNYTTAHFRNGVSPPVWYGTPDCARSGSTLLNFFQLHHSIRNSSVGVLYMLDVVWVFRTSSHNIKI